MSWLQFKGTDVSLNGNKVLSNINVEFKEGENISVIGPNGSGKSTFIGLINRTIYPDIKKNSFVKLFGSENINIWETRSQIGFVYKDIDKRIPASLTCKELVISGVFGTIGVPKRLNPTSKHTELLKKVLNDINIKHLANKTYSQMSDGEQRKCIIARALINKPKILILDEINHSLDIKSSYEILSLLEKLSKKMINIINFDNVLSTILPTTNRVIFIKGGRIINDGKPKELINSESISRLFNSKVHVENINDHWITYPAKLEHDN